MALGDLFMRMGLDIRQVDQKTKQVKDQFTYLDKVIQSTGNRFMSSFLALFSLSAVIRFGQSLAQDVKRIDELRTKFSLTSNEVQKLQSLADSLSVTFEELTNGGKAIAAALDLASKHPVLFSEEELDGMRIAGQLFRDIGRSAKTKAVEQFVQPGADLIRGRFASASFGLLGGTLGLDRLEIARRALGRIRSTEDRFMSLIERFPLINPLFNKLGISSASTRARQELSQQGSDRFQLGWLKAQQKILEDMEEARMSGLTREQKLEELKTRRANIEQEISRTRSLTERGIQGRMEIADLTKEIARLEAQAPAQKIDQKAFKPLTDELISVGNFLGTTPDGRRVFYETESLKELRQISSNTKPKISFNANPFPI